MARRAWVQHGQAWAAPIGDSADLPELHQHAQEALDKTMELVASDNKLLPSSPGPAAGAAAAHQVAGQAAAELQQAHARELWRASGAGDAAQWIGVFGAPVTHSGEWHRAVRQLNSPLPAFILVHRPAVC